LLVDSIAFGLVYLLSGSFFGRFGLNGAEKMTIYRMVVTIPSEVFLEADDIEKAYKMINYISENYDKVAYPVSVQQEKRTGVAQVKLISIEEARADDDIRPTNFIKIDPETPTEPPEGPKLA